MSVVGSIPIMSEKEGYFFVMKQINNALNRIPNNNLGAVAFVLSVAECLNDQHPMMIPNEINFNFNEDFSIQFDLVWHIVREKVPQHISPYKDKTLIVGKTQLTSMRDSKSKQTVSAATHYSITNMNTVELKGEEYAIENYNKDALYEGLFDYYFDKYRSPSLVSKTTKRKMYENWTTFFNDHVSFSTRLAADTNTIRYGGSVATEYPTKKDYTDFLKFKLKDEDGT